MGMFDTYKPAGPLRCPVCGRALEHWQGKDGPCALLLWEEGRAAPVGQDLDEEIALPPEDREAWRLPEVFEIYSYDCPEHPRVEAQGRCVGGVWSQTALRPFRQR